MSIHLCSRLFSCFYKNTNIDSEGTELISLESTKEKQQNNSNESLFFPQKNKFTPVKQSISIRRVPSKEWLQNHVDELWVYINSTRDKDAIRCFFNRIIGLLTRDFKMSEEEYSHYLELLANSADSSGVRPLEYAVRKGKISHITDLCRFGAQIYESDFRIEPIHGSKKDIHSFLYSRQLIIERASMLKNRQKAQALSS